MLAVYLLPNEAEEGVAERALAYADLLVERESPEVETLLETVQTFADEWSPEDLRRVALGGAEVAEAYVAGLESCADCELPPAARQALIERGETTDVKNLRRLSAAERLRALVE